MGTQKLTELYEQLREVSIGREVARSMLLRGAFGVIATDGVVGLIDHFEELYQITPENNTNSLPERQTSSGISGELLHILTDVALAAASTEIIQ